MFGGRPYCWFASALLYFTTSCRSVMVRENCNGRLRMSFSILSPKLFQTAWLYFRNLVSEFIAHNCQKSAAALTYMTLFALVPMMMVTYSMFSLIPAFEGVGDQLQSIIFSNFVPETGSEVQKYLGEFSQQARSLTLPGVAMLVVTAYLMLTNIERTFNGIWGVEQARRGLSSFLLYWAVLSIGPLFLGAGLLMSTYFLSLKLVVGDVDLISAATPIFRVIPLLMGAVAFTLLFAAVPNCRVPIRDALIGGVVTAVCFELAKAGFGAFVANSSFQLVYGAFAAVPLFLLWVNFIWMIVLAGAVFVRILAEKEFVRGQGKQPDFVAILLCLEVFYQKSQSGELVSDRDCVAAGVGLVHWQLLRSLLVKHKWVAVTDSGHYVLSRNLKQAKLWDIARLVDLPATLSFSNEVDRPWFSDLKCLQGSISDHTKVELASPLESLYSSS